jgi:LytS/YehU family sensor histidine kinase
VLLESLNSFIESTCVIVVFAYLLTRNPVMALLLRERLSGRSTFLLGGIFGLAGMVELYFVQSRFPYDTYALIITFAALRGGWKVGTVTALFVSLGACLFLRSIPLERTLLFILVALCAGIGMHFLWRRITWGRSGLPRLIIASLLAVVLADTGAIFVRMLITEPETVPFSLSVAALRFAADGLGIILLQLILSDAQTRIVSERFQVEAARSRTLLAEAKLTALRARIHPHFLFNTLTTIAALCRLDAEKAEAATVQLAQIMRRALEVDKRIAQPLETEIEYVRDYVEIEKLRLGNRLKFLWHIAPQSESALLPAFVLQTLVENAIQHGIIPKMEDGCVEVITRIRKNYVLVVVRDDGVGMSRLRRSQILRPHHIDMQSHGIVLANEQLVLLYGPRSRLRVFSKADTGTLVLFRLPIPVSENGLTSFLTVESISTVSSSALPLAQRQQQNHTETDRFEDSEPHHRSFRTERKAVS